jgi:hypothetical protein
MRLIYLVLLVFLGSIDLFSQIPGISYQAVIMNPEELALPGVNKSVAPLSNKQICLKFSLINSKGDYEYEEVIQTKTDAFGMVNLVIGKGKRVGGTVTSFEKVSWSVSEKFLEVALDKTGECSVFNLISKQAFTAVPFALFAFNSTPGSQGPVGPQGPTGPQGVAGVAGPRGLQGVAGPQGPAGTPGLAGASGSIGLSAYQVWLGLGNTGTEANFISSLTGPQGPAGATGPQGPVGSQGLAGPQGPAGGPGSNGLSAYQVWLGLGNAGTEANFISSLTGPQGPAGTTGPQGVAGAAGPQGATGLQGVAGPQGPAGAQGPTGSVGAQGSTGADGKTVLNGTSNPTNQGVNGDFYINTSTNTLFGPKANNLWPSGVSLVGPQGPTGPQGSVGPQGASGLQGATGLQGIVGPQGPAGPQGSTGLTGADGKTILNGTSNPTNQGVNGDFYINTNTNTLFGPKANNSWPSGVSLVGPQGATGPQGPAGIQGATGSSGLNGLSAYQVWLGLGNSGTETDFMSSLSSNSSNHGYKEIFSSTSWTVPNDVRLIKVYVIGGGGGGGNNNGSSGYIKSACGGGAGGYVVSYINVIPNESLNITIGNGGIAGVAYSSGSNGGDTKIENSNLLVSALGGSGGLGGPVGTYGGIASGGSGYALNQNSLIRTGGAGDGGSYSTPISVGGSVHYSAIVNDRGKGGKGAQSGNWPENGIAGYVLIEW